MSNNDVPLIREMNWQEARDQVHNVDKQLAELIDKIDPDKSFKLIKAIYSYGDLVIKDGILNLPKDKRRASPIYGQTIERKIKEKLSYSTIPLFLTLHNCNEVFIDTGHRVIPLNLFHAGSLLGLFESIDYMYFGQASQAIWSVSAGARTTFTLSKINESGGFKRLKMHYRLPSNMKLQHFSDHWHLFKAIATHPHFEQPWRNEVLFFTKEWLIKRDNDPNWVAFHRYLFQNAWQQARFAIGKVDLSLNWEAFIDAISSRRLKPTPYLADQVKHIMLIVAGRWPGFRPADNSQQAAPTQGLQKSITDIYSLKHYVPTIMHAYLFKALANFPVYYSLYFPTLLEGSPNNKSSSTIMLDLRGIQQLLEILIDTYSTNKRFGDGNFKNIEFEYFHVEPDKYEEIQPSKNIIENDPVLSQECSQYPGRIFCATSPFWRGCIRISSHGDS
jgi:hypothetical protein